jgi:Sporulation lipoprotein YhcN/YlaJ (Spore_YhcN_YlaJ).
MEVIYLRRRFPIIVPVVILFAALLLGGSLLGRNWQRTGQNGANRQARNYIGLNLPGTSPGPLIGRGNRISVTPTPGAGYNGTGRQIQQQTGFDRTKADNLRNRLGSIDGIRQINAIVNGNTALIGYTPSGKASNANSARQMITDRVKQLDNTITNVVVSDSADFSSRISRLVDKINSNKSLDDLTREFNQLMQNIKTGSL